MGLTKIYQTPAYNKTPKDAAREFAAMFWAEPRRIDQWERSDDLSAKFTVEEGTQVYQIYFEPGQHLVRPALYFVDRLNVTLAETEPQDKEHIDATLDNLIFRHDYLALVKHKGLPTAVANIKTEHDPATAKKLEARLRDVLDKANKATAKRNKK